MISLGNISALAGRARARPSSSAELCLALWVGRAPEPEPLSRASRRLVEQLPQRTRDQMELLDAILPEWPLKAVGLMHRAEPCASSALAILRERSPHELDRALMRSCTITDLTAARAIASARRRSTSITSAVLDVLERFWERCFSQVWELQRGVLEDVSRQIEAQLASDTAAALEQLTPRARAAQGGDALFLSSSQQSGTVDCATLDRLEVLPSLWLRRSTVVIEAETHIALCVQVRERRGAEALSAAQLVHVMNVLGDAQRFEIVRLCNRRARSTQELSRRLGLTPAPVSRHLRQLREVDLVVGRRVGRYVLYEAIPETLALLISHLDDLSREATYETELVASLGTEPPGKWEAGNAQG